MKQTKNTKNTFTREIPALVIVFMAFGLVPISSKRRLQVFFQFYQLLISSIVVTLLVYVTLFVGYVEGKIAAPVNAMVFTSKILAHLVTLGEAYFTRRKQQEFFETISEIDESFRTKLGVQIDLKKIKKLIKLRVALFVSTPIICLVISFVRWITYVEIARICAAFSVITLIVRCLQNMTYVTIVESHLNFFNEKMEEIILRNAHFQPFIIFAQEYRQLSKKQSTTEKIPQISENKRILEMKQIFNRLWDAMNLINDCFGWSILIISISYFLSITTCIFYLFVELNTNFDENLILYVTSVLTSNIMILGILAWACQNCARCGHNTGSLLQKMKKVEDESYNFLVSEFQLQVMHEPFEMSAHGFFTMNFEFLGSMAAASVTYLVILIQFVFEESKT